MIYSFFDNMYLSIPLLAQGGYTAIIVIVSLALVLTLSGLIASLVLLFRQKRKRRQQRGGDERHEEDD